jgi:hypothetical protein
MGTYSIYTNGFQIPHLKKKKTGSRSDSPGSPGFGRAVATSGLLLNPDRSSHRAGPGLITVVTLLIFFYCVKKKKPPCSSIQMEVPRFKFTHAWREEPGTKRDIRHELQEPNKTKDK